MEIYVIKGNERRGPYSFDVLVACMRIGDFSSGDLMWRAGMEDWAPIIDALSVDEYDAFISLPEPVVLPRLGAPNLRGVNGLLGYWCVPDGIGYAKLPILPQYWREGHFMIPDEENWSYFPASAILANSKRLPDHSWIAANIEQFTARLGRDVYADRSNSMHVFAHRELVQNALINGWVFVLQTAGLAAVRGSAAPPHS